MVMSSQCCLLPVDSGKGRGNAVRYNPIIHNYQCDKGDPAVLVVVCSTRGTSAQIIECGDQTVSIAFVFSLLAFWEAKHGMFANNRMRPWPTHTHTHTHTGEHRSPQLFSSVSACPLPSLCRCHNTAHCQPVNFPLFATLRSPLPPKRLTQTQLVFNKFGTRSEFIGESPQLGDDGMNLVFQIPLRTKRNINYQIYGRGFNGVGTSLLDKTILNYPGHMKMYALL